MFLDAVHHTLLRHFVNGSCFIRAALRCEVRDQRPGRKRVERLFNNELRLADLAPGSRPAKELDSFQGGAIFAFGRMLFFR
jgi:hypothetical protein